MVGRLRRRSVLSVVMAALLVLTVVVGGPAWADPGDTTRVSVASDGTEGNGYSFDLFCPGDMLRRGQMAAFLNRALHLPPSFVDRFVDDDDSVFEADIQALAAAGITLGYNPPVNDRFCPDENLTRGQMAAL